jgi:hypothetical protein
MPQPLYACITGLVRPAGKYIAKDDYTMYNEKAVDTSHIRDNGNSERIR